jgi:hypothetical protein
MKLVKLIETCLNPTYSKVCKHLCNVVPILKCLKQDALLPLLFNFTLECTIRMVEEYQEGLELNGTQFLVYAGNVNFLGVNINTLKRNMEVLLDTRKKIDTEVNGKKTMFIYYHQKARQNYKDS